MKNLEGLRGALKTIKGWFLFFYPNDYLELGKEYQSIKEKKLLLLDISRRGDVFYKGFVSNDREAAFHEGRRSLALEILELANITEQELVEMLNEQLKKEKLK